MRVLTPAALTLTALFAWSSPARAQPCLGLPSFEVGAFRGNLSAEFPEGSTTFAAGLGAGRHNSIFGTVGGGVINYDDSDESARLAFVEAGWQIPVSHAQVCPLVGGFYAWGPDNEEFGLTTRSHGLSAGLALGAPVTLSAVTLIPNIAVRYQSSTAEVTEEGIGSAESDASGNLLDLGLALLLANRISIQPLYHIPFGGDFDEEDPQWGLFVSLAVGRR